MSGMQELAKRCDLTKDQVELVFVQLLAMVAEGTRVQCRGFGTFERKRLKGRTLQSPGVNNGEPTSFKDKWVMRFRVSAIAKQRLNVSKKARKKRAAERESE